MRLDERRVMEREGADGRGLVQARGRRGGNQPLFIDEGGELGGEVVGGVVHGRIEHIHGVGPALGSWRGQHLEPVVAVS